MMAGFIVFVLGRSGVEGSLRAGAGCCSAVACFIHCRVPGFTPSPTRLRAKLTLLATAGAGFSFRSFQLCLPPGLSSSEPVIC